MPTTDLSRVAHDVEVRVAAGSEDHGVLVEHDDLSCNSMRQESSRLSTAASLNMHAYRNV